MLNLGQIQFGLGVDTRALQQATQRVVSFGAAVENAAAATGRGARAAEAAFRRQEAAALRGLSSVQQLNDAIRRGTTGAEQTALLNRTTRAFDQYSRQLTQGQRSQIAYQRANESFAASMGTVQRRLAQVRAEQVAQRQGMTQFGNFLRELTSASILAIGPLSGVGARIAALGVIANRGGFLLAGFLGGVIGLGAGLYKLSTATIQTALDLGAVKARLESASGASEIAQSQFDDLKQMASNTGVEFVSLADQFTRFQAAAQGTSLEGDKARQIFENLAFAIGAFQLDAQSAEGVFRAVEQMMSKGTVTSEELRQQLGDRLPGAFKAAADATGKTTAQLNKLLKTGKLSTEQFLLPFSQQVRQRLAGDVGDSVVSLRASVNRLQNAFTFFNLKFDEAFGISTIFQKGVESLTSALDYLGNHIKQVVGFIGAFAGGLSLLALPRILAGFASLLNLFTAFGAAFIGLNAIMAASPLGAIGLVAIRLAAIFGGAAIAVKLFGNSASAAEVAQKELKDGGDALIATHEAQAKAVTNSAQKYVEAAKITIQALMEQLKVLELVDQGQKDFIKSFDESGKKWFEMGLDQIGARLLAGAKQASGAMQGEIDPVVQQITAAQERLKKLQDLANKKPATVSIGDEMTKRQTKAIREAGEAADDLARANAAMTKGPSFFEHFEKQDEINKKIREFKEKLVDAEVPIDIIKQKVDAYSFALEYNRKISEGTFAAQKQLATEFRNITVQAFDDTAKALSDAIVSGKLNAQSFVDVVKTMASSIIQQILKLAVINPILNSIFNPATPFPAFGGGIGSLLGFAKGGAFSGGVQMMAKGGILQQPTMFHTQRGLAIGGEAGTEAVMPLVRTNSGHLGVRSTGSGGNTQGPQTVVNVVTPPGSSVQRSQRQGNNNTQIVDLVIETMNNAIAGGRSDRSNNARFGARARLQPVT
jgi:tape measure domain-containing protein